MHRTRLQTIRFSRKLRTTLYNIPRISNRKAIRFTRHLSLWLVATAVLKWARARQARSNQGTKIKCTSKEPTALIPRWLTTCTLDLRPITWSISTIQTCWMTCSTRIKISSWASLMVRIIRLSTHTSGRMLRALSLILRSLQSHWTKIVYWSNRCILGTVVRVNPKSRKASIQAAVLMWAAVCARRTQGACTVVVIKAQRRRALITRMDLMATQFITTMRPCMELHKHQRQVTLL